MASCAVPLKSKAYFFRCPAHEKGNIITTEAIYQNLENMGIEISEEDDFGELKKEISQTDFHGYASLLFFVELQCYHMPIHLMLNFVYHSILLNSTLKYVTKLVISYSQLDFSFSETHLTVRFKGGIKRLNFEYPTETKLRELFPNLQEEHFNYYAKTPGASMLKVLADSDYHRNKFLDILRSNLKTRIPFIDNLIVIACVQTDLVSEQTILGEFMENLIAFSTKDSIQELALTTIDKCSDTTIYQDVADVTTTCGGGCYIYNINPALAIVFNHQNFNNSIDGVKLEFRTGSLLDVEALQRTFRIKKIPYITIKDGSRKNVRAIMEKVRNGVFNGLKDLFIVIMSHGDRGDIIYTKTKPYSIRDDIVTPLLENPTLIDAQKFVIVNACRGTFDPRYNKNIKQLMEIQKNICENLKYPQNDKLMMVFSTQKGCISLRFDEEGSIFVQEICDNITVELDGNSMEAICQDTKDIMADYVGEDQIPEFEINENQNHVLRMDMVNFYSNQEHIKDMFEIVRKQFKNVHDESLSVSGIHKNSVRKIFGIGYADGILNSVQQKAMENRIKSKYDTKDSNNCEVLNYHFDWSVEERTDRSRVLIAIADNKVL